MLPSSMGHATSLALAMLPSVQTAQTGFQPSSLPATACAFCGLCTTPNLLRRRTRGLNPSTSCSSQEHRQPYRQQQRALIRPSSRWCSHPTGDGNLLIMAASRWGDDEGEQGGEHDDGANRTRPRAVRRSRTAPWEDIRWSNVPAGSSARKTRVGGVTSDSRRREVWDDRSGDSGQEVEDGEEEGVALDGRRQRPRRRRTPSALDDDDGDDEEEVDDDFITDSRRRRPQATKRPTRRTAPPLADDTAQWNAGWFRDAQQADQGGMFEWARSFYNALFWYGGASEDLEQLPAMNFQDLLERFDAVNEDRSPDKLRPIVPPEDLGAEQDYRWRPSIRDSTTAGAPRGERRRRREPPPTSKSRERDVERIRERDWAAESAREAPMPPRRGREEGAKRGGERGREQETQGGRGSRGRGGWEDEAAIAQLRRKQKQLVDREHSFEMDLEKVRERLGVVDATVELWLRRSAGMAARGSSESDTDMLQAKRRIYGLKDEGRQLDSARAELEGRLEDCRAKLERIVQELALFGEDEVPNVRYDSRDKEFARAEAFSEGEERKDKGPDVEVEVVGLDNLELKAEIRDLQEIPAAVGEADP